MANLGQNPGDTAAGVVEQAITQYPILAGLGIKSSYDYGAHPGYLEFWNKTEEGTSNYQRPSNIPLGSIGLQILSQKTTPTDVLADVASHYLRKTDPTVKSYYQQFVNSLTPMQHQRLQEDYAYSRAHEGETRPFGEWLQTTRLPAYFRGYTFNQWPSSFTSKLFTPQQIAIFNKVRSYLGVGK